MSSNKQTNTYTSESIFQKRIKNFKKIKQAYFCLVLLGVLYILSLFSPILISEQAFLVKYNNSYYSPAFNDLVDDFVKVRYYEAADFGQEGSGPPNYRKLKKQFAAENKGNWVMMPLYPYGPIETPLDELGEGVNPPTAPDSQHILGTDTQGRDIFARAVYGFQISISFAIIVTFFSYLLGILLGAFLGYYGGRTDLIGLRVIEVFNVLPFLFIMMILVKFMRPSFIFLVLMIVFLAGWRGITYFVRAEFYREKARDYVAAARAMGATDSSIMFKHILPNALTSVITFAPFAVIGNISSLVALDFLGFGLPVPTPSWGELIRQGSQNISDWWLIMTPLALIFFTLTGVTFIGEGVRQAFDPREYSRLQ